ncbi:MAG: DoxX family protein [Myxococcales bacterium]|nr:DoxX family protein [Myxococcales bacterium]
MTNHLTTASRVLLGTLFVMFGANGFLHFLPTPAVTEAGGAFLGALAATGYMFPLIKGLEVAAGIALLSGRSVPLALTLLAPITINIFAFHLVLSPGIALPAAIVALQLQLAWAYRDSFRGMLDARARPARAERRASAVGQVTQHA